MVPVPRTLDGVGQKVGKGLSIEHCLQPLAAPMVLCRCPPPPFLELAHVSSLVDTHLLHPINEETES